MGRWDHGLRKGFVTTTLLDQNNSLLHLTLILIPTGKYSYHPSFIKKLLFTKTETIMKNRNWTQWEDQWIVVSATFILQTHLWCRHIYSVTSDHVTQEEFCETTFPRGGCRNRTRTLTVSMGILPWEREIFEGSNPRQWTIGSYWLMGLLPWMSPLVSSPIQSISLETIYTTNKDKLSGFYLYIFVYTQTCVFM